MMRCIWKVLFALIFISENTFSDQDASCEERQEVGPSISCTNQFAGKLMGKGITYSRIRTTSRPANNYEEFQDENFITMSRTSGKSSKTKIDTLLYWKSESFGDAEPRWDETYEEFMENESRLQHNTDLTVVAFKNTVQIYNHGKTPSHLIAKFKYSGGRLFPAQDFRAKILAGMYKKDSTSKYEPLLEILERYGDDVLSCAIEQYRINNEIARGNLNNALSMLGDCCKADTVLDFSLALDDSVRKLIASRKPVFLEK